MKKHILFTLNVLFLAFLFSSCDGGTPQTLTFEDVYGRDTWEIDVTDNGGYMLIAKQNEVDLTEIVAENEKFKSYKLITKGSSPTIITNRVLGDVPGPILTFRYKASEDIEPFIKLDVKKENSQSKMWMMEKTDEWKVYTFDLGILMSVSGWGGLGSSINLVLGDKPNVTVEISDIQLRGRDAAENKFANSFFFRFANRAPGQMKKFEDLTEVRTYGGNSYMFWPITGANDCNMQSEPREVELTVDDNQLFFEYKCDYNFKLQIFWLVRGGDETHRMSFPASANWTSAHVDLTDVIANKIFVNFPNAGAAGRVMRLDIDNLSDAPLYIRGLRLSKK